MFTNLFLEGSKISKSVTYVLNTLQTGQSFMAAMEVEGDGLFVNP